jgi:hypothetical protein
MEQYTGKGVPLGNENEGHTHFAYESVQGKVLRVFEIL